MNGHGVLAQPQSAHSHTAVLYHLGTHSRPRSGSACRGNIDLYATICISRLQYRPLLVHSHLPRGPCLPSILMCRLLRGLPVTPFPQRSQVRGPQRPPLLRLHWLQKLRLHPSIKYSSALRPFPEVNPLSTTPSTLPGVYLFFQPSYIYFLIVVTCHRPKTEPSSPDHTVQHTRISTIDNPCHPSREGSFSPREDDGACSWTIV